MTFKNHSRVDPWHRKCMIFKMSYLVIYLWITLKLGKIPIPTNSVMFRLLRAVIMFAHETIRRPFTSSNNGD